MHLASSAAAHIRLGALLPPHAEPDGLTSPSTRQPAPQFGTYGRFNWSDEVDRFEAGQDEDGDVSPTPLATGASFDFGSDRCNKAPRGHNPLDPDGLIDAERNYDYYEEDAPKRTTAAAMMDPFDSVYKGNRGQK